MLKANKDKLIIIILIITLTGFGFYKSNNSDQEIQENKLHFANTNMEETENKTQDVYVHIDGEVVNRGIYKLTNNGNVTWYNHSRK